MKKNISYLALGDSYTIGQSVSASERYPVILADRLSDADVSVAPPRIIATTGWTTNNLKNGIISAGIDKNKYDVVSLLIGVNNQFQGRSITEYKTQFTELLQMSISFAYGNKDKVFVISIPDYGYTPFGHNNQAKISSSIDQFNAVNKAIVDSMGIKYFDITSISRNGLLDPELVAGDGLHPSGKQYQQWVDLMASGVRAIVKK
ncbi:MAG TPA: SGNH/GDSL hydrolase family protein [Cytophagaceae bacterium]|nr:SGNH/GDSL hydrolase family protein [Cytophagaceae bacterium]